MRAAGSWACLILLAVACVRDDDAPDADSVEVAPGVTYSLEDGERYHRQAPDTFEIPRLAAREALVPGRIVKLMFKIRAAGGSQVERMWVIVEARDADGYSGTLDNQPATTDSMRPGMKVRFRPRHVISIHPKRADGKPAAGPRATAAPAKRGATRMRDWRPRLEHWVRVWGRLPELTQDCYPVRAPAGGWPDALPACPALADFYARCDGGTFGPYDLDPAAELDDPAAGWFKDSPGLDPAPGQYVRFGNHEYGHAAFWDVAADEVVLYSPDDQATRRLGRTIDEFLGRLFRPSSKATNEATQLWAEALAEAETLA